jgi:hypothetical protein
VTMASTVTRSPAHFPAIDAGPLWS